MNRNQSELNFQSVTPGLSSPFDLHYHDIANKNVGKGNNVLGCFEEEPN